ncbi:DUF1349 domain-containing protein [Paenibacillus sp. BIHB 4019]|nr:DUF1349 domain-containing protein [Paenibacillus sp. BIHB 4019]
MMNVFEGCSRQSLSKELSWINEPKSWEVNEHQQLVVQAPPMGDFFIDPAGGNTKNSAPFLYTLVEGDFYAVTRVAVDMKQTYDSGCLMIMAGEDHWAKLCSEFFDDMPSILSVVTRGASDDCVSSDAQIVRPFLRIARAGNSFAFHYSMDGVKWKMVRYFGMDVPATIKVGVVAQSPIGEGSTATFDYLKISTNVIGDIRSVN